MSETPLAGEHWRDKGCGCVLIAASDTRGPSGHWPIVGERVRCPKESCATHVGITTYAHERLGSDTPSPRDASEVRVGQRRRDAANNVTYVVEAHPNGGFALRWDDTGSSAGVRFTAAELARDELVADAPATPVTPPKPQVPAPSEYAGFRWENGQRQTVRAPEMQRAGEPLTALQTIQARKKPEPWVPSVDEYDLLPDAVGAPWIKDA